MPRQGDARSPAFSVSFCYHRRRQVPLPSGDVLKLYKRGEDDEGPYTRSFSPSFWKGMIMDYVLPKEKIHRDGTTYLFQGSEHGGVPISFFWLDGTAPGRGPQFHTH